MIFLVKELQVSPKMTGIKLLVLRRKKLLSEKMYKIKFILSPWGQSIRFTMIKKECKLSYSHNHSRKYLRSSKISFAHLNQLRRAFMDCDENGKQRGVISKREFLLKIADEGSRFPLDFLV